MELTDIETKFVEEFINNNEMYEAVKKAFEQVVTESESVNPKVLDYGRKLLPLLTDEQVGANLRARINALEALEVGFSKLLAAFKRQPQILTPYNKAR